MALELNVEPQRRRRDPLITALQQKYGASGFTLIEVLIASLLLMVIALGTLPLFMRSIIDNASGRESTQLSNFARSQIEEYSQLDFNSAPLTIDTGSEKVTTNYYSQSDRRWIDGDPPSDDPAAFTRTVTVRQFSVAALQDQRLDPGEAMPSGTGPSFVHLKEIVVSVQGQRQSAAFGTAKQITLRILKAL